MSSYSLHQTCCYNRYSCRADICVGTGHEGVELEDRALRYRTLCILTDVDVDRSCIRVMLLIFFFLHQMELMEKRYLYIAQLPLCKFVMGSGRARTEKYTFWEEEY